MKTKRKAQQCVCCGFNAVRGTKMAPGKFICSACETEAHGDAEDRYRDEEWAELDRIEAHLGRMETY